MDPGLGTDSTAQAAYLHAEHDLRNSIEGEEAGVGHLQAEAAHGFHHPREPAPLVPADDAGQELVLPQGAHLDVFLWEEREK